MNIYDASLFTAPDCLPCCDEPAECSCAYEFYDFQNPPGPGGGPNPFATVTDARTYINDFVGACFAVAADVSGLTTVDAASFDGTTVDITATGTRVPTDRPYLVVIASVTIAPSDTLTITTVSTTCPDGDSGTGFVDSISAADCEGNALTPSGSGTGYVEYTGPSTGIIVVTLAYLGYESATSITGNFTITSSGAITTNPAIALWDDSGTTRQLEACPKMLLPPLTESTGDWYADCATADADIAANVSNCAGYCAGGPGLSSFTATDGGTSLTLATTHGSPVSVSLTCWGGINALSGQTITVNASVGAGTAGMVVNIYDDTGTLVQGSGSVSSPWTSSALPYTGRYTISVIVDSSSPTTTFSATITSSGTMSVNPIQAVWDSGLTCPSRLDCGDSCP